MPADIDIITENMFKNCVYLESIKINGIDYDGTNVLPNVDFIGSYAFESCVGLSNLTISDSVSYFGHSVFNKWGINIEHQKLNLDFYEGFVPGESDWNAGIEDNGVVQIKYREPTTIYLDLQDGSAPITIQVKPGLEMPKLEEFSRIGYEFKGIYDKRDGRGLQYYTNSLEVARLWQEGESDTLYVNWDILFYNIKYDLSQVPFEVNNTINPKYYTVEDGEIIFNVPHVDGYTFTWTPARKPKDTLEDNFTTVLSCEIIEYPITYILDGGTNHKDNPSFIDVTDTVELHAPVKSGYLFVGWKLNDEYVTVLKNITGPIVLVAEWTKASDLQTVVPSEKETRVTAQKVLVDLTDASYISGCKLKVANTVKELYIYSSKPVTYYMSIEVESRGTSIAIHLVNVSLRGTGYCDTISIESEVTLDLYAINSAIYGQEGARGADGSLGLMPSYATSGEVGGKGYVAIKCHKLVIHNSITIYGGTGGTGGAGASARYPSSGGNGGTGGYAVEAVEIVVSADGVRLVGGNGGKGGRGALDPTGSTASSGGTGGAGCEATNAKISGTYTPELVTGEQGANGQKGSWGPVEYLWDETKLS